MKPKPPKTNVAPGTYTGQQVAIKTVGKIDLAKKKRRPIDYPVRQKLTRRHILLDNKGAVVCFCVNEWPVWSAMCSTPITKL